MNAMHDLGGMDGFGPVVAERDEPPFHQPWEGRVMALARAMGFAGAWTIDEFRASIESIDPVAYLTWSYYAKWLNGLEDRVRKSNLAGPPARRLTPADVPQLKRGDYERAAAAPARFAAGDRVRTRNLNPVTHTRLPRYARDKTGTIEAIRGCHVFPDTVAIGAGEQPQWLYTVVFAARDLWGDDADPALTVSIEAFEPYLTAT